MDRRKDIDSQAQHKPDGKEDFAQLVKKNSRRVFTVCYAILGNVHDAEDLTQETFVKGYRKIGTLKSQKSFPSWIVRIARNRCLDFLRARKQAPLRLSDTEHEVIVKHTENHDLLDLQCAILRLPENLKVPLLMYYFDGHNTESIAEALKISKATVHTRLSRARRELHDHLGEKETTK